MPEAVYLQINGEMIRETALRTKGAGGPCGVDVNGFRRILACKSFKQSSSKLCDALAQMTKIMCTQYIDPTTIEPLMASRLIPLDKGEGAVRPIGVGEVLRRILAKCVMNVANVAHASGSLQLCAGQKSGSEAAVHAMHAIFEADETDGILLIDATNAFNSLNRAVAQHNIGEIKNWWDSLTAIGPDFGYFPNAKKCWIIVKPDREELAKELFQSTAINVTTEGHKHLGAVIGSEEYQKGYIDGKVTEWVGEIVKLAEIATTEPQACYSAYIFGLKHKWTYFLRTIPDTQDLLEPLSLIPTITGHKINQLERDVLSLPVRCGGLGFGHPQAEAARELKSSVETISTAPLVDQIMSQRHQLADDSAVNLAKQTSRHKREEDVNEKVRGHLIT